jgi:hypothetical protein
MAAYFWRLRKPTCIVLIPKQSSEAWQCDTMTLRSQQFDRPFTFISQLPKMKSIDQCENTLLILLSRLRIGAVLDPPLKAFLPSSNSML